MQHSSTSISQPLTILLHGLHQTTWVMRPLAKRLQQAGLPTHCHRYYSLKDPIFTHSQSLNNWLNQHHHPRDPINLVGHSLGGLVIRDFLSRYPQWQIGRCVTLGTPHTGSVSADYVKRLFSPLVRQAYTGALNGDTPALNDEVCLGVIAGNKPRGVGQLFLQDYIKREILDKDKRQHDGSVFLYETRLPNATDHIILPVSHTGMLMDKTVAQQTIYFLNHGQFKR